jgi:hypothetical protein
MLKTSQDRQYLSSLFRSLRILAVFQALFAFVAESSADGLATTAVAPLAPGRVYHGTRLTGPAPVIDGRLDDACWKNLGEWSGNYTQREPREGAKGSLPTELKVLYDDRYFYVAIRAYDPDVARRPRRLGSRDEFTGDMVGINFDSYHDRLNGFEFDVTSGGSKIDLVLHNDGSVDTNWNAIWEVKVAVEESAWTAEFRIPLSQLRYQKGADQTWGMHSWRWINSRQEESDWNLIPMDHHGMLYSFGEIDGIRDLPASRRLEVAPYAIAKVRRYAPEPGNPYRNGRESSVEGGLDVKYGLGSNLTLDLTVNPDFSQVDADPSEINLTTVETFLTERRPLFLEGKDIFEVKIDDDYAFYTRRIGDAPSLLAPGGNLHDAPEFNRILGAAKLTGHTQSGLAVGLLQAVVDRTTVQVLDSQGTHSVTVEPPTNDTVVRLQQSLDGGNTQVGTIFSSCLRGGPGEDLQTLARRAFVAGVDAAQYFGNRTYLVEGRVLVTEVTGSSQAMLALMQSPTHNYQRPDADYLGVNPGASRLSGDAGYLRAGRVTGLWRYNGFVSWRSPGVDFNDLGYMQVADFIAPGAQLQYYDASAGSLLRRRDLRLKLTRPQNYGGEQLGRNVYLESEFATLSGSYLSARLGAETSRLDMQVLRGGPALHLANRYPAKFYLETDGGKPLQYKLDAETTASGGDGSLLLRAEPGIVWRLGGRLKTSLSVGYEREREAEQYAGTATGAASPVYFIGHFNQHVLSSTLRLNFNFSPALSLSYYGGPFAATGRYSSFKAVAEPRASDESRRYENVSFQPVVDGSLQGGYRGNSLRLKNPDFNWREFKSNLVLRWEYKAGSFVYCVWSQYRSDAADIGGFAPSSQYERLFSAHPDNTLLLKFSYWFSI